jgi:uncharacterized phage protein (TIGR02218 family)
MRPTNSATLAALAIPGIRLYHADLFTITLLSGTIYRWTDFDVDVLYTPHSVNALYSAQGPLLQRSRLGVKNTVEVPELVIRLSALDTDFVGGLGIKTQIHNGYFDGASVALDRVFFDSGTMYPAIGADFLGGGMFNGRMSQAKLTAVGAELTAKGANVLMNQYAPRNIYQIPCMHAFCDPGCTLSEGTFTLATSAGVGSTRSVVIWSSAPGSPGLYTLGKLTMTSGAAIGQIRTVKLATAAGITLQYPLYNAPANGDTFSILKGCDKSYASGSGQSCTDYANTQHYRGFPSIPPAETAF